MSKLQLFFYIALAYTYFCVLFVRAVKNILLFVVLVLSCQTILAQIISLDSDGSWKTTTGYVKDWLDPNFDDSGWGTSVSPAQSQTGGVNWPTGVASMWLNPAGADSAYFRKSFDLRSNCVESALFQVLADNSFELWINGTFVGSRLGLARGTYTNISTYLKIGRNVICIRAYSLNPPSMVRCKGTVRYTSGPIIDLGVDKFVCEGDTTFFTVNHQYQSYQWSDGQTTRTIPVTKKDKYWCTARDTAGCPWVDTVELDIYNVIPVNLGPDTSICDGDIVVFNADKDSVYVSYLWNTGDTTRTISAGYQDQFNVTVTDKNACQSKGSRRIRVFVSGTAVDLGPDTTLCKGDSLLLKATFPQSKYSWEDGSKDSVIKVKTPGTYIVTVSNFCGEAIDAIVVNYINELNVDLGPDDYLCSNLSFRAGQEIPRAIKYEWSTKETTPFIEIREPGIYQLKAWDFCGNFGEDEIEIIRDIDRTEIIPNAFSPNRDGLNETWRTYIRPKTVFNLKVMDRWNHIVFETNDPKAEWDGYLNDRQLPAGKYIYTLTWDECENQPQQAIGTVQIVR